MGRKSKLKQDRRAAKIKNNNQESASASASAKTTTSAIGAAAATTTTTTVNGDNNDNAASTLPVDDEFPRSDCFLQAAELRKGKTNRCDVMTIVDKWLLGATEYGCIHSMYFLGMFHCDGPLSMVDLIRLPTLGVPFLLEGSIRGSFQCVSKLAQTYAEAKPHSPQAIIKYWMNMASKYYEWNSGDSYDIRIGTKKLTDHINRKCVICGKTDTVTLTLRQCMGCSTYCYCSEICQTKQWEEQNHRNECKQVKILNKYHKPYAKEIREALIQGEVSHPALHKLRRKLGLTRPTEEYKELNEGKPIINPFEYIVARNDGTVWIGSAPTPSPIRPPFDTTTTTTTTATTTASAKDDQLY